MGANARSDLAQRLRAKSASVGEVFSFISGLYFRGKLTYATAFCAPNSPCRTVFIITSAHGLVAPDASTSCDHLREMADSPIHPNNPRYRAPLERDLLRLASETGANDFFVLLGSIATPKYVEPLFEILGDRLMIPSAFVGLGDMARGALLLRAVREVQPLSYQTITNAREYQNVSAVSLAARIRKAADAFELHVAKQTCRHHSQQRT